MKGARTMTRRFRTAEGRAIRVKMTEEEVIRSAFSWLIKGATVIGWIFAFARAGGLI